MKKWFMACVLSFIMMQAHAEDVIFISTLEDIPLMQGLIEAEGGMHFDTPGGRIVETYAVGTLENQEILKFYSESLPSLGWKQTAGSTFEREGEVLSLSIEREQKSAVVRFALSPKS